MSTAADRTGSPKPPAGRTLDAGLHLLDRQVLDRERTPTAVVDDIEFGPIELGRPIAVDAAPPVIEALLSGPVLATRIFGGRPPSSCLHRIAWRHIADIGTAIVLGIDGSTLDVTWTERWVRDHVIGRIPGGRHDPE